MVFRRKQPDPEVRHAHAAFRVSAAALDAAQRRLLGAVPTYRNPGAPLAIALDEFTAALDDVETTMPAWRRPAVEHVWQRCADALREARAEAGRLRAEPPGPEEFEKLNARLGDVLAPLEEFADAEQILRGRPV